MIYLCLHKSFFKKSKDYYMPNILTVDDHSVIRKGLKQIIVEHIPHCKFDEAIDGDTAYEKIRQNNFDLIILDVNMPNTDSFGLLSNILSYKPESKIIMFSINSEDIYAKRYLKIGAMGYLTKGAPVNEIIKAIDTVLNNKRYISTELSQKLLSELHANRVSENPFDKLSSREFEIVQHLAQGESVSRICNKLNLHSSTVSTYKARIFEKLGCQNIVDLNSLAKVHNVILS